MQIWLVKFGFPEVIGSVFVPAETFHDAMVVTVFASRNPGRMVARAYPMTPLAEGLLRRHHSDTLGEFMLPDELADLDADLHRRMQSLA